MKKIHVISIILLFILILCGCGVPSVHNVLPPPEYLLEEEDDESPQTLTIYPPQGDNVKIYYTLDGSEPTTASSLYQEPLLLERDTSIKSIAVDDSGNQSSVASAHFRILNRQSQKNPVDIIAGLWTGRYKKWQTYFYFGNGEEGSGNNILQFLSGNDGFHARYRILQASPTGITIEIYDFVSNGLDEGDPIMYIDISEADDGIIRINDRDLHYISDETLTDYLNAIKGY